MAPPGGRNVFFLSYFHTGFKGRFWCRKCFWKWSKLLQPSSCLILPKRHRGWNVNRIGIPPKRCRVSNVIHVFFHFSKTMQNHWGSHVEDIAFHSALHMIQNYLRSNVRIKMNFLRISRLRPYVSETFEKFVFKVSTLLASLRLERGRLREIENA